MFTYYYYYYLGQCPAKSPKWYFFKISRTSKREVTLAVWLIINSVPNNFVMDSPI